MEREKGIGRWLVGNLVLLSGLSAIAGAQPPTSLPRELHRWTLSAAPVLGIGAEGDPNTEFLRIAAVTRMPSGEVVVGNGNTAELRVFSPNGIFMRSLSRRGQGPGELENFSAIFRGRDTLFAIEFAPGSSRLHVFTLPEGFRNRSPVRASNAPRGATPLARLSSGEFLVTTGGFRVVQPVAGLVTRDTMPLGILRVGEPGEILWFGEFPNNSWLGYASPSVRGGVGLTRYTLGPSLVTGASADRVWIGDSGTGAITIFNADGKPVAHSRVPLRPRAFSEAALERAKRHSLASASNDDQRARYESLYDKARRPGTAPLFTRFIPSAEGQMAVELFEEDRTVETSLIVFDPDGTPVAGLVVPSNVMLHEIGSDYALGVQIDDDGVERVVQYRLHR